MRYECSQCERQYTSLQYDQLDRQQMNPGEENPLVGEGYETVCECGAGFHSDKWQINTELDVDGEEVYVTTRGLNLAHGMNYDEFYETSIYHPKSDYIADRYTTKDEAKEGHERLVDLIKRKQFHFEAATWQMVLEDDD